MFAVAEIALSAARRHLPAGVPPAEIAAGRGHLLVNVVHLLMGGMGLDEVWNLDVAIEVEADHGPEPVDRASYELVLTSDSPGYLSLLEAEGHRVYRPRALAVDPRRDGCAVAAADADGRILSLELEEPPPGYRELVRIGQKLSLVEGVIYARNYRFSGRAARLLDRPRCQLRLYDHPFFKASDLEAMVPPCGELMVLQPGTLSGLDYRAKRRYLG